MLPGQVPCMRTTLQANIISVRSALFVSGWSLTSVALAMHMKLCYAFVCWNTSILTRLP